VEHALTLVEMGAAVRRAGRPAEARRILRQALLSAEPLGAISLAQRARAELTMAGGRPPAPIDTTGVLTPSEQRVAELAAAGHTNRQIADTLFITVKAVEWHLSNAYRKLRIRGRAELPGTLRKPGDLVRDGGGFADALLRDDRGEPPAALRPNTVRDTLHFP
jgi:DNA-binding CsgD family transcriptional regulator